MDTNNAVANRYNNPSVGNPPSDNISPPAEAPTTPPIWLLAENIPTAVPLDSPARCITNVVMAGMATDTKTDAKKAIVTTSQVSASKAKRSPLTSPPDKLMAPNQSNARARPAMNPPAKLPITDAKEVDYLGRDGRCFYVSLFRELD